MRSARQSAISVLQLMMVASVVLPALLFAFASWVSYRAAHAVADERIDRSLDILHEHALKVFQTVEQTMAVVDEMTRGLSDEQIRANHEYLHRRLAEIVASIPQLQGIALIDRDGHPLIASSTDAIRGSLDFSDRAYFTAQRDRNVGVFVSEVLTPRLRGIGKEFFALSRRRPSPDGSFNGVISVAVLPSYFEEFYARIGRSEGSYYAMARADGSFLARYPVPADRSRKLDPSSAMRQGIAKGLDRTIYTVEAAQLDQIGRRIGYRKLAGFPVYVLAGTELSAIADEWRSGMAAHLVFGVPATLVMVGILFIALKRTRNLHDEAERREAAEAALRQAQRLEAIGQLTGGVAHDFNNLLMVVTGSVQRLRRDLGDERHVRLLDMISTAAQRGESLTRQLLAFSRRQTLQPEVVDLCKRLPDMKEMLTRSLRGDIEIKVEVPEASCTVNVDPSEFELAILNLAVNARDAMPNGGRLSLRVKPVTLKGEAVSDQLAGEFAAIRIADNGVGIPPEIQPRVFEPFFTTKEIGKGTGLGLSQVYGFAKQSGGTATVTSRVGRGTTITLYLPISNEVPAAAAPAADLESQAEPRPARRGTVLLVEDNAEVAEVCTANFELLGFRVVHMPDARAALEYLARGRRADLVFSDILMPGGMNGLEMAGIVRERYPSLPVMLSTGYSTSAQDAVRQGFVVLQKPYDLAQLDAVLAEVLSDAGDAAPAKARRRRKRADAGV